MDRQKNSSKLLMYHHHHDVRLARISLTLSLHVSLSFIAFGRSSGLHPVSSHSCCMNGRPAFDWPYAGVHRSTSLTISSLLLQQCSACLVRCCRCFYQIINICLGFFKKSFMESTIFFIYFSFVKSISFIFLSVNLRFFSFIFLSFFFFHLFFFLYRKKISSYLLFFSLQFFFYYLWLIHFILHPLTHSPLINLTSSSFSVSFACFFPYQLDLFYWRQSV